MAANQPSLAQQQSQPAFTQNRLPFSESRERMNQTSSVQTNAFEKSGIDFNSHRKFTFIISCFALFFPVLFHTGSSLVEENNGPNKVASNEQDNGNP